MQEPGRREASLQEALLLLKCPSTEFYLNRRHTDRLPPLWRPPSCLPELPEHVRRPLRVVLLTCSSFCGFNSSMQSYHDLSCISDRQHFAGGCWPGAGGSGRSGSNGRARLGGNR
jgi:hypothetical protein